MLTRWCCWSKGDPDFDLVRGLNGGEGLWDRPFSTTRPPRSGEPRTRRGGGDIRGDRERRGGGLAGIGGPPPPPDLDLSLAEGGGDGLLESSLMLLDRLRVPMPAYDGDCLVGNLLLDSLSSCENATGEVLIRL